MTLVTINSFLYSDISTIGDLMVDRVRLCHSMELSCRTGDEKGLKAILPGRYHLSMTYWPKYGKHYPLVDGVKDENGRFRTGLFIHPANRASELDGCVAPGYYNPNLYGPEFVGESRKAFKLLMKILESANQDDLWIEFVRGGQAKELMAVA